MLLSTKTVNEKKCFIIISSCLSQKKMFAKTYLIQKLILKKKKQSHFGLQNPYSSEMEIPGKIIFYLKK